MLIILTSHSSVQSKGLREGFWPFDEGDWKLELEEIIGNYSTREPDLEAIRAFRDKELLAGRWSDPLPNTELLPGTNISPMFVVWQNQKPRVVTDHSASGLSDGIPRRLNMMTCIHSGNPYVMFVLQTLTDTLSLSNLTSHQPSSIF